MARAKYRIHPLRALFGVFAMGSRQGMEWLLDRGLLSDLWEHIPEPEELCPQEVIAIFRAAKVKLNPTWCDRWIDAIEAQELEKALCDTPT